MQELLNDVLNALLLFLPAYLANMAPVLLVKTRLFKLYGKPIDAGKSLWGERILGDGKTYYGLIVAMIGGAIGALIHSFFACINIADLCSSFFIKMLTPGHQEFIVIFVFALLPSILLIGALIGLGAILGDTVKSFFKRRLKIASGKPWIILYQIDFIVGAWIVIIILFPGVNWNYFYIALVITPLLHLGANVVAYKLKLKKVWW